MAANNGIWQPSILPTTAILTLTPVIKKPPSGVAWTPSVS